MLPAKRIMHHCEDYRTLGDDEALETLSTYVASEPLILS